MFPSAAAGLRMLGQEKHQNLQLWPCLLAVRVTVVIPVN